MALTIIKMAAVILGVVITAIILNNAVESYMYPGLRLGGSQESQPFLSQCARILTFTVLLSLPVAIKSFKLAFTVLSIHIVFLIVSGYIVFWA